QQATDVLYALQDSLCLHVTLPRPPTSTLFPYTTLFRSVSAALRLVQVLRRLEVLQQLEVRLLLVLLWLVAAFWPRWVPRCRWSAVLHLLALAFTAFPNLSATPKKARVIPVLKPAAAVLPWCKTSTRRPATRHP